MLHFLLHSGLIRAHEFLRSSIGSDQFLRSTVTPASNFLTPRNLLQRAPEGLPSLISRTVPVSIGHFLALKFTNPKDFIPR
jgi:hypothetical protein